MSKPKQYKELPQFLTKQIDEINREVTGIYSVFGNLDSYDDRMHPGSFTRTFQQRGVAKTLHLWQHNFGLPPIAIIKDLREVTRDELPDSVLAQYPEATGGAEVTRQYLTTPLGDEVYTAIKAGAPLQMSFGFDALRFDFEEKPNATQSWEKIRNVREVRLYETSDVLFGANDATVSSKMPLATLVAHLQSLAQDFKAGNRHSARDFELIDEIARAAVELGARNIKVIEETLTDDAKSTRPASGDALALTRLGDRVKLLDFLAQ